MEFVGFDGRIHANIRTKKYNHVQHTGKGDKITVADAWRSSTCSAIE
jgi:hypothetical protein